MRDRGKLIKTSQFLQMAVYVYYVVPNVWKVLKYYETLGFLDIHQFAPAGDRYLNLSIHHFTISICGVIKKFLIDFFSGKDFQANHKSCFLSINLVLRYLNSRPNFENSTQLQACASSCHAAFFSQVCPHGSIPAV